MRKLLLTLSIIGLACIFYRSNLYYPNVGDIYYMPNKNPFENDIHVKIAEIKEGYVRYYFLKNDGSVVFPYDNGVSNRISHFVGFCPIYKLKEKANKE